VGVSGAAVGVGLLMSFGACIRRFSPIRQTGLFAAAPRL